MLDYKYLTNSYKIYWLLGTFHEVINGNREITFERIAFRMIAKSWYPIIQYKLKFGQIDQLENIILTIYNTYKFEKDIDEDELVSALELYKEDKIIQSSIRNLCKYVPYRLIRPFFNFKSMSDHQNQKTLIELSKHSQEALYKVTDNNKIIINECWYNYMVSNQTIIDGWIKYKLIYFLQKRNTNVPAIPFKLSAPKQRNLSKAKKFWNTINEIDQLYDIYTNLPLNEINVEKYGAISIDHFIPWSFVLHDETWNLVPTFRDVNSSKSDKLPNLDKYFYQFCNIHYNAIKLILTNDINLKLFEDYLNLEEKLLNKDFLRDEHRSKKEFINSLSSTIYPLHQIAQNQGFEVWN
jgi:hypothetical protein